MLEIAKEAASVAGAYLQERFLEQLVPDEELHNDVKLPEDKESERRIIEVIHRHFPTHTIFSEEVGMVSRDEEYLWIVDPLDGTNNYFIGFPYFSVSLEPFSSSITGTSCCGPAPWFTLAGIFALVPIMQLDLYLAVYVINDVPAQALFTWKGDCYFESMWSSRRHRLIE